MRRVLANAPDVAAAQHALIGAICTGLPMPLVELAILGQAVASGNDFCWAMHVPLAAAAGVSDDKVRAVRDGNPGVLTDEEEAWVRFARAVASRSVSDGTWDALRGRRSEEDMVKITMLVGFYLMIDAARRAFAVPSPPGGGRFIQP
jgi:alkylhydroperoxidase family enzyme